MDNEKLYDAAQSLPAGYREALEEYFENSPGTSVWKLQNFAKYVPRQSLTRLLLRNEIFQKVLKIQGSIIECGVLAGGSLMTWAQLSAIFEPMNVLRKIVGFDTFAGFPHIMEQDKNSSPLAFEGGLALDSYEDIKKSIELYEMNRLFKVKRNKVELVKGDIAKTAPKYMEDNPHLVISLLYLDVDIYEPTKVALQYFVPRMPKGGIIVFDELNDEMWPGETLAVLEEIGLNNLRIERFTYDTSISYAVLD